MIVPRDAHEHTLQDVVRQRQQWQVGDRRGSGDTAGSRSA